MAAQYHVTIKSKKSYGTIDGSDYCIWCYKIVADSPLQFTGKIGLAFSRSIDIKDPALFPEVDDIDDTHLDSSAQSALQFIYKQFAKTSSRDTSTKPSEATLCFIAPCAENSQTALGLMQKSSDDQQWASLPVEGSTSSPDIDNTLKVRGPAATLPFNASSAPILSNSARSVEGRAKHKRDDLGTRET